MTREARRRPESDSHPRSDVRGAGHGFKTVLVILVVLCAAAFLRIYKLGVRDFWFDESCTHYYIQNLFAWPAGSSLLAESTNLPYYVLLHAWTNLFGDSESALRSMSAVAGLLTIPFLGLAARSIAGPSAAMVVMLLAAVHPLGVYYAREARAYALWMLMLAVLLWLLVEAVKRRSRRWWMAYGAVLLLTLHLHYFTVYGAVGSAIMVLIARDRRLALRRWVVTHVIVGALWMPFVLLAVLPAARGGGSVWIGDDVRPLQWISGSLRAFLPAGDYPAHLRGLSLESGDTHSPWPLWVDKAVAVAPLALLLLVMWVRLRRRGEGKGLENEWAPCAACVGSAMAALVLAVCYSAVVRPTYLVGRYDLVAWAAFVVGLGACLTPGPGDNRGVKILFGEAVMFLAVCSVVVDARMLVPPEQPSPHQRRAKWLAERAEEGDLILALSYDRWALHYYLHREDFRGEIRSFPTWIDRQVGWVDTAADMQALHESRVGADAARVVSDVSQRLPGGRRVWLLADSLDPGATGARAALVHVLLSALHRNGVVAEWTNEELFIFRLIAPPR